MTTVNEEESKIGEIILPSSPGEELFKNSLSEMNMSSDGEENIEKMEIVEKVEKLKEKQKESKDKIEDLFNSLMQKAFNGELVR